MVFNTTELLRYEKAHSLRLLVSAPVKTRSIVINFRILDHLLASLWMTSMLFAIPRPGLKRKWSGRIFVRVHSFDWPYPKVGSISAVSRVRSLILPARTCSWKRNTQNNRSNDLLLITIAEEVEVYQRPYYSFKIFPQFWLAKSTRIIHHNQLLMTKFGRILSLTRKWRQKCSLLQINAPLTEKTWRRGWVVLVVNLKNGGHFTCFKSKNQAKK